MPTAADADGRRNGRGALRRLTGVERRRFAVHVSVGATVLIVVGVVLTLQVRGPTDLPGYDTPEAAVRATCHASRTLLGNDFGDDGLRDVAWQSPGQPSDGPGWNATVHLDDVGAHVINCKDGTFTKFPLPG